MKLFCLLLVCVLAARCRSQVSLGCFSDDVAAPTFVVSAGSFNPDLVTPSACAAPCKDNDYEFAGVQDGRSCLCANDISGLTPVDAARCTSACSGNATASPGACGGPGSLVSVYEAAGGASIDAVTLYAAPPRLAVAQEVVFSVELEGGSNVQYRMSYGDGATVTLGNATGLFKHRYAVPGRYSPTLYASDAFNPQQQVVSSVLVEVEAPMTGLQVDCPALVHPGDSVECRSWLASGPEAAMSLDPEGGSGQEVVVGASLFLPLGPPVPQSEVLDLNNASLASVIMLGQEVVDSDNFLLAYEAYVTQPGSLELTIQSPACSSGELCPGSGQCESSCPSGSNEVTCASPNVYHPSTRSCYPSSSSPATPTAAQLSYTVSQSLTIPLTTLGYVRGDLSYPLPLRPRDVVVLNLNGGAQLAHRNASDNEKPDKISSTVNGQWNTTSVVHYFRAIITQPSVVRTELNYSAPDNYTYTVNCSALDNQTQSLSNRTLITVIEGIGAVSLSVDQMTIATKMAVNLMTLVQSGSTFQLDFDFGDGQSSSLVEPGSVSNRSYNVSHQYDSEGTYTVTVNVHNLVDNETDSVNISVLYPVITGWTLHSNSPQLMPTGEVNLTLGLSSPSRLPSDASALFTWDQLATPESSSSIPIPNGTLSANLLLPVSHAYRSGGVYNVTLLISNAVSNLSLWTQVSVVERIQGVSVALSYVTVDGGSTPKRATGTNKDTVPTGSNVIIDVTTLKGSVSGYSLTTWDGQYVQNSSTTPLSYAVDQAGSYNLSLFVWNEVEGQVGPLDFSVRAVEDQVGGLTIDDFFLTTNANESKSFELVLTGLTPDHCVLVSFNASAPSDDYPYYTSYGSLDTCLLNYSIYDLDHMGPASNPLNFSRPFAQRGIYSVTVLMFNQWSVANSSLIFTVTDFPCPKPSLVLEDARDTVTRANNFTMAQGARITTLANIQCPSNVTTKKQWSVFAVDEVWGVVVREVEVGGVESSTKSVLFLAPLFLPVGSYKLVYVLSIWAQGMDPRFPWTRSIFTYIRVIPSPLTAIIIPGAMSYVLRGNDQQVLLDPSANSIDPDQPGNQDFNVTWLCRRVSPSNETFPVDPLSDDLDSAGRAEVPSGRPTSDGGGCFGTGVGALAMDNGTWLLSTALLYASPATYEVVAVVAKGPRKAVASLQVEVVVGAPPTVFIRCQNSMACHPFAGGLLVNPNSRLGVTGYCQDGCVQPLGYLWNIYTSSNNELAPDGDDYMVGQTECEMAMNSGFFGNVSAPDAFDLELQVSGGGGVGRSSLHLQVNRPPTGGSCSLSPPTGRALLDTFQVRCTGWTDPEAEGIGSYTYFVEKAENVDPFVLATSSSGSKDVVLPYGELQLRVSIEDTMGSAVTIDVALIDLSLPSLEEYNAFVNSSFLSNLAGGGQQEVICQVFQAMTSVQGPLTALTLPPPAGLNETNGTDDARRALQDQQQVVNSQQMNSQMDVLNNLTASGSLQDLEMLATTLQSVAGSGADVDIRAKQKAVDLVSVIGSHLDELSLASPQAMKRVLTSLVATMSAVSTAIGNVVMKNQTLPADLAQIDSVDYDGAIDPDMGDPDVPLTLSDMHSQALQMETKLNARIQAETIQNVLHQAGLRILSQLVPNEEPIYVDINGAAAVFGRLGAGNVSNLTMSLGESSFSLPSLCALLGREEGAEECSGGARSIGLQAVQWPSPLETYARDVNRLAPDTRTVDIQLYDEDLRRLVISNSSSPIDIFIPRSTGNGNDSVAEPEWSNSTLRWNEVMVYHSFGVDKPSSSVNIELTLEDPAADFLLFVRFGRKPTLTQYDFIIPLQEVRLKNASTDTYDWFVSSDEVANRTGVFYLGVSQPTTPTALLDLNTPSSANLSYDSFARNLSSRYGLLVFSSGCYFYSAALNRWVGDGCWVADADRAATHCQCSHLTSFGTGFFVAPTAVNFDYVFAHASFNDNLTIYMTIIVTVVVCLAILIYARYKDRKDLRKLGAAPLPDNLKQDKYLYEILVFTGSKKNAATDSKVFFILSGDSDETEVREMGDDQRKTFERGSVDVFIMAVPKALGPLNYMRVWHDNTGSGARASWYLNYVVVRDVQTGDKYEFIANTWFGLEYEDGAIDRLLPVAGKEQRTEFSHLMSNTSQRELADGHLWFSIFLRPPRSRFTRVQRVGCCMAFLYLSMLVNAMWYGTTKTGSTSSAFTLGPFSLSTEQIGVGLLSNLIVFPPSFLIVFFFRKARPRILRASRIQEALRRQNARLSESKKNLAAEDELSAEQEAISKANWQRKKKFSLHWSFRVVAWALVLACIGTSVFFLWAYGITFGEDKTKKWITSLVISFFASVLITEPIKLFLMALVFSAICKTNDLDSDDADEDEEDPVLLADENYLHNTPYRERRKRYFPPDPESVEEARKTRLKEIQMWSVLKEILGYLLFLWILVVVSYGNRDPNAYFFKRTLHRSFIRPGLDHDFNKVLNDTLFWNWTSDVLVPQLRAQRLYNDKPPFGYKGFLQDQVNRMMGYAIMRQIRIEKGLCDAPEVMRNVSGDCSGTYTSMWYEDEADYGPGWAPLNRSAGDGAPEVLDDVQRAFRFQDWRALDGSPTVGQIDVYSGGGYVIPLKGRQRELLDNLRRLQALSWIDRYTRSVNVEFSVFNAQVNLFGVCTIGVEMIPGGGFFPSYRFDGIRLLEYHTGFGLVVLLCQLLFALIIFYFTVKELIELCRLKRKWFNSYWNVAEVLIILLSLAAIAVFAVRFVFTQQMLKRFNETGGNAYINLQYVYSLDQAFGNILAIVVFVASLRFIKLLRFNRRMGILSSTLAHAWGELAVFGLCFFIVFLAFVQLFYLLMSANSPDFGTFVRTVEYTFSMMLQNFVFSDIENACPVLGAVAFFFFSLMTSIVLVNLLLTIIIRAFEDVAKDIFKQPNDYEIVDFIVGRMSAFLGVGTRASCSKGPERKVLFRAPPVDEENTPIGKLSESVDRLVHSINRVYFKGKIDFDEIQRKTSRKAIVSG